MRIANNSLTMNTPLSKPLAAWTRPSGVQGCIHGVLRKGGIHRLRRNSKGAALKLLWLVLLLPALAWARNEPIHIVYSGNIDGELEPCGCSVEGNSGGILRHSTTLKKLRRQHPGIIALSGGGMLVSMVPQDKLTGEYILKGFAELDYDAVALQWNDLAYGMDFVRGRGLPWVASNWSGDEFAGDKMIKRDGHKLFFFAWLDPAQSPQAAMHGDHKPVSDDPSALAARLKQAQQQGLTVLSTTLTLAQARALPLQYVDILLIRAAYEEYGEPQMVDATLVLQPGSRGMRLGKLELTLNDNGRIEAFEHRVISMPPVVEDDPALADWYGEYNAKVKAAYLERAKLRKAMASGESPFVGEEACQDCHQQAHDTWRETPHSNAFAKLEEVNKAFDPACIKCHTVGFEREGGFIDTDATPHLMNVQCENCHGAGRAHAESAGFEPLANQGWRPQQMCAQCHVQKHSPAFDFKTYWPRIKHPVLK